MAGPEVHFDRIKQSFWMEYLKEAQSGNMSHTHYHEHYEVYYQMSGERTYFIEDQVYAVKTGDLVLINICDLHRTTAGSSSSYGRILIEFNRDFMADFFQKAADMPYMACFEKGIHILPLTQRQQTFIEERLFLMLREYEGKETGFDTRLHLLLADLLICINRYIENPHLNGAVTKRNLPGQDDMHEKIAQAARYINESYADPLSLQDLAKRFNISYFYFCRMFREVTGFTLTEYVANVRVRKARRLLEETDLSITLISGQTGFDNCTSFGRVFRQHLGTSPLKYRKHYKSSI